MQETGVWFPGGEDPLEKGMATHSKYFCLENPMDRGSWQATVHGVTKSQTRLSSWHSQWHFSNCTHICVTDIYIYIWSMLYTLVRPIPTSIYLSTCLSIIYQYAANIWHGYVSTKASHLINILLKEANCLPGKLLRSRMDICVSITCVSISLPGYAYNCIMYT